jgi:hypothetical protein
MKQEPKIRVRLFGGLGNQLFQYFAGLDVATKLDSRLELDFRWITSAYSHDKSDIQDFEFLKNIQMITTQNSGQLNYSFERLKTKLAQKSLFLAKLFNLDVPRNSGFNQIRFRGGNLELRGYYQSYLYFQNLNLSLGRNVWKLNFESTRFREIKNILAVEPFIAMHVRGGDYLRRTSIYHKLDVRYFDDSLMSLRSELGDIRTFVFTDDCEHAREILKEIPGLEFFDQEGLRASEAMILISMAKGIIISNSTFSYWAAIINSGRFIIAPKYWFLNTKVDDNLYPPNWQLR